MCGSGRVGPQPSARYPNPLHAWQDPSVGIVPDMMTMGKGLGGGFQPIATMLANHKVIDVLAKGTGAFSHGQTYQAHPMACRAALEVQRVIQDEDLVSNVRTQGKLLGKLLRDRLSTHKFVGSIRGQGLFWGIEFVRDKATKMPFDPSLAVAMGIHELGKSAPKKSAPSFCFALRSTTDTVHRHAATVQRQHLPRFRNSGWRKRRPHLACSCVQRHFRRRSLDR